MKRCYELFKSDSTLMGMTLSSIINPLITSPDGQQYALKGKRKQQMNTFGLIDAL